MEDVNITFADISKAQKLFDYHPRTPLRDGLVKFKNWYEKNK
jgi:UDP-glucuronate 4-epimerase